MIRRLDRLEEIANTAAESKLYISLSNTKAEIRYSGRVAEFEAETPLEIVEAIENHIMKKAPNHVIFSYWINDIFDLYPEYREAFGDFAPIPVANLTTGDYYASLGGLTLKHIMLYNHVHAHGGRTVSNEEKGIVYSEEDFIRIFQNEFLLFAVLLDIITKEQHWRDTSPDYKPNRPGYSYGNMEYGKYTQ